MPQPRRHADTDEATEDAREPQTTREDLRPRRYVPIQRRPLPDDYEPDNDDLLQRRP